MLMDIRTDVRDTRKEQTDGFKAVRSELAQHARDDAEGFRGVQNEMRSVRAQVSENAEKVARLEGRDEGEDRFAASTGRFNVPPMARVPTGHDWAVQTPAAGWPAAPPAPPKRESGFWSTFWHKLKKWAGHGAVGVVVLLGTESVHFLAGKGCGPAQQIVQAASEKPTPATSSPPVVPLPFPEPATRRDLPTLRPDAGR